jgi:hypothetical protein
MGWETRERGGRYYYRKIREGSRVRSEYVGSGFMGHVANAQTEGDRSKRETARKMLRREIEKQNAIDARIDAVCDLTEKLVTAALIASGFHQHKRQWRLKRNGKEE